MGRVIYYPEQLGIYGVRELVEVYFDAAVEPLPVHSHPDAMELCFLAGGSQAYAVGDARFPIRGGQMFLTYPNEPHQGATPFQERCRLYYLIVDTVNRREDFLGFPDGDGAVLAQSLQEMDQRVFFAGERTRELFEACFSFARTLTQAPGDPLCRSSLRCGIFFLLREILERSRQGLPGYSPQIQAVLDYFSQHLEERLLLCDAAGAAQMSLEQLKRRFRREVGIAPGDYLLRQKVQRAGELIRSGYSVTQAAFQLGFSSSQHFARVFKKYFGFAPSQLRPGRPLTGQPSCQPESGVVSL